MQVSNIRYCIEKSFTIGHSEDFKVTSRINVEERVFIDILEIGKEHHVYKVNIFLEDGSIIKDVYILNILGEVKLFNEHLLFDGRFNSCSINFCSMECLAPVE